MPSPYPGMDPYLEGYLWPDVHHRLATQISDQLTPQLRPRYVAHIEIQVVVDDEPEGEVGIMYPDVEVVRARRQPTLSDPVAVGGATAISRGTRYGDCSPVRRPCRWYPGARWRRLRAPPTISPPTGQRAQRSPARTHHGPAPTWTGSRA